MVISIKKQDTGCFIATAGEIFSKGDSVKSALDGLLNILNNTGAEDIDLECDIPSLFDYFPINVSAFARMIGINQDLMRQYKKGNVYISTQRLMEIENAVHRLAKELSTLSLV